MTIERSVSMGRLNFRDFDSEHLRNGAHLSRVKQRSHMFQKDSTQPPPKLLISSVSEDRSVLEPRFRVAAARSWSSDDILSDPPHTEHISNPKEPGSDVLQDFGSPQQSFTHSPSSVPESLIGDSAINSPDSWTESELNPDRFCESRSDISLCDSGSAWDVYRATPVEVTPYDEGFISSVEDRVPDESIVETSNDEGVSSPDRIDMQTVSNQEEEEEDGKQGNTETLNQDTEPDLKETKNTKYMDEVPLQQDAFPRKQESLDELCETDRQLDSSGVGDLQKSDQLNQFEPIFSTEPPEDVPLINQDREGKNNRQAEGLEQKTPQETGDQRTDSPSEHEVEELHDKSKAFNEANDSAAECQDIFRDSSQYEEASSSETPVKLSAKPNLNIPLISITSEPEELDEETELYPGILDQDGHEDQQKNTEVQSSQVSELLSSVGSKDDEQEPPETTSSLIPDNNILIRDPENESLNDLGDQDGSYWTHSDGDFNDNRRQKEGFPEKNSLEDQEVSAQSPPANTDKQPDNPDGDSRTPSDVHRDKQTEKETENSPKNLQDSFDSFQNILDAGSPKPNGQIGMACSVPADLPRNLDLFSSDFGRRSPTEDLVGDRIEPMDLFYPDKEESIPPELPDTEMQRWPSVLSVSALQPAPSSDRPQDPQLDLLSDNFLSEGEQDHVRFWVLFSGWFRVFL